MLCFDHTQLNAEHKINDDKGLTMNGGKSLWSHFVSIATRRCPGGVLCHNCHKAVEKDRQYLKDNGLSYVLFYKKQDQN